MTGAVVTVSGDDRSVVTVVPAPLPTVVVTAGLQGPPGPPGQGDGISEDAGQLLPLGSDAKPLLTADEATPEAIGAAPAAAVAVGWDDLCREAAAIPLQGQSGDPDRDTDGTLLFSATSVEQCAIRYQMPHRWTGTNARFHIHWSKTTDAAGEVVWQRRYRAWNVNTIKPDWSSWETATGRSMELGATQHTVIDQFPEIPMEGLRASAMLAVQLRRLATDAADTYGADARLEDADVHFQGQGNGSAEEYPEAT